MAAVMDLQSRVAGECLVADVTRCVAAHCIQINPLFNVTYIVRTRDETLMEVMIGSFIILLEFV